MSYLAFFSDVLLLSATLGMAGWFTVLARRMRQAGEARDSAEARATDLAATLTGTRAELEAAQAEGAARIETLTRAIAEADDRIGRLELLMTGIEDLEADLEDRIDGIDDVRPEPDMRLPSFRASRPHPSNARNAP